MYAYIYIDEESVTRNCCRSLNPKSLNLRPILILTTKEAGKRGLLRLVTDEGTKVFDYL